MRRARMTVHVSTKINRSHLVCGDTALILPTRAAPRRTSRPVVRSGSRSRTRCVGARLPRPAGAGQSAC